MSDQTLSKDYLVQMYGDCGLEPEEAAEAAEATWRRMVTRTKPDQVQPIRRGNLRAALVRDPMVSFNRIVGLGDDRLPFIDEGDEEPTLSLVAFASLFDEELGLDPDVALAFAKVVVEANEPRDLFQPVWEALGQSGELDLESLRRLDWSPLREGLAKTDLDPTTLIRVAESDED